MKKLAKFSLYISFILFNHLAFASSGGGATGLPWEKPIEILKNSLLYLGGLLVIIGLVWAGYAFLAQQEKEAGFKRLMGTLIGGAIIFGASGMISILFGANF
jgi:type IV secretory pathway VirB2 component (pilin)